MAILSWVLMAFVFSTSDAARMAGRFAGHDDGSETAGARAGRNGPISDEFMLGEGEFENFPLLCDQSIVDETCLSFNRDELDEGEIPAFASSDDLSFGLSAQPHKIFEMWNKVGLPKDKKAERGPPNFYVSCMELCVKITEYISTQTVLPPKSDVACREKGFDVICDMDVSPSKLADLGPGQKEDLPDFHDDSTLENQINLDRELGSAEDLLNRQNSALLERKERSDYADLLKRMDDASPNDVPKAPEVKMPPNSAVPINHAVWELVERTANLFRIYPALRPVYVAYVPDDSSTALLETAFNRSTMKWRIVTDAEYEEASYMVPQFKGGDWREEVNKVGVLSKSYLSKTLRAFNKRSTQVQLKRWFGASAFESGTIREEVLRILNSVIHMISNVHYVRNARQCSAQTFAFVYPKAYQCTSGVDEPKNKPCTSFNGKYVMYLCDLYFARPWEQVETIVHEGSHHATSFTKDVCTDRNKAHDERDDCQVKGYGRDTCKALAKSMPERSIMNADTFCYYVQDVADEVRESHDQPQRPAQSHNVGPTPITIKPKPSTPITIKCPQNAATTQANQRGDCRCKAGQFCTQHGFDTCDYAFGKSSIYFKASCHTCGCMDIARVFNGGKPQTGVVQLVNPKTCPPGAARHLPDSSGDCSCPLGTKCIDNSPQNPDVKRRCPAGNGGGVSSDWFRHDCTNCKCEKPQQLCPSFALKDQPDQNGDCECPINNICFQGGPEKCKDSSGAWSSTRFKSTCVDCLCKARAKVGYVLPTYDPVTTMCPLWAALSKPDFSGDCMCPTGSTCRQGGKQSADGCKFSGGISTFRFATTCASCSCYSNSKSGGGLETDFGQPTPTVSIATVGGAAQCPSWSLNPGITGDGGCMCPESATNCYENGNLYCSSPWSGGKAVNAFRADCKTCKCM